MVVVVEGFALVVVLDGKVDLGVGLICGLIVNDCATDRQRGRVRVDHVDVEVIRAGLLNRQRGSDGGHDARRQGVFVLVCIGIGVARFVVLVFVGLPVGVTAMPGRRLAALDQPGGRAVVEHAGRQCDVAGAPHRVALAHQHGNQHEQPEHHE